MRIDLISAVPETFDSVIGASIIKRAVDAGLVEINTHNLHDYALDRYRHIDDTPYGGGAGMLIKCQPLFDCIEKLKSERNYDEIIFMTADGRPYTQEIANNLSLLGNVIILSGHYKGIDQRVRDALVTLEISIGDFILTGGELPALIVADSVIRLIPGAIGDAESALEDSFMNGMLEAPQYTKPAEFRGMKVPAVLQGGNHAEIKRWQYDQAILKTKLRRPDLFGKAEK